MAFCAWLQHSGLVTIIANSNWFYTVVEVSHYFSVFVLVGTAVAVDLRLLGWGGRGQSASQLTGQIFPWMWTALAIAIVSGLIEFSTSAVVLFSSTAFRVKLLLLIAGIVLAAILQRRAPEWDQFPTIPGSAKLLALVSLVIWLSMILAGTEVANFAAV